MQRPLPILAASILLASLACGGVAEIEPPPPIPVPVAPPVPTLTAEDMAGETFAPGARVKAARSKKPAVQNAKFIEQYGKIAKLSFADYNTGWVLVKAIDPPGAIQLPPAGDTCDRAVGDRVNAPWSTSLSTWNGTILEVHGKMALIEYDDNELDWADCGAMKDVPEASSGGGGGGQSDAVTKCKRGCTSQCRGAQNVSKCTGQCRRACDG